MRTTLDLFKPIKQFETSQHNIKQESQFNKQHRARDRKFSRDDLVYTLLIIHMNNGWNWTSDIVIERIGNIMYNILLDSDDRPLVRCHTNHLISRHSDEDHQIKCDTKLPLDLLMEEFRVDHLDDNHVDNEQNKNFATPKASISSSNDESVNEEILEARPRRIKRIVPEFLNNYVLY